MNYKEIVYHRLYGIILLLLLVGCDKAENYYTKLHNQPEIVSDYDAIYGIGDTITIRGRLNPGNGLRIRIGDSDGEIVDKGKELFAWLGGRMDSIDVVKVLISEAMGIGANRAISITSSGNTISTPAIEIYEGDKVGLLPDPLKLVEHYRLSAGAVPLRCQNGNGVVYLWEPAKGITRIAKDGSTLIVLGTTGLSDQYGAFAITTFNGGGVDLDDRYLYFSAVTTDNSGEGTENEIYRLCRMDLQTNGLITLNRTLYPKAAAQRTLASTMPFEGDIAAVKIFRITNIYPDRKGNVFFDLMGHYITRLDSDGRYSYVYSLQSLNTFIPQVSGLQNLLPGTKTGQLGFLVSVDIDEHMLYLSDLPDGSGVLAQYDLLGRVPLAQLNRPFLNTNFGTKSYISGSFSILTGSHNFTPTPAFWGYMALPGQRLLLLNYQSLADGGGGAYYSGYAFPAWTILDFKAKRGIRYAPGKLERGSYRLQSTDLLLNSDEDGMLYMTANTNSAIVKTTYQ